MQEQWGKVSSESGYNGYKFKKEKSHGENSGHLMRIQFFGGALYDLRTQQNFAQWVGEDLMISGTLKHICT